MQNPSRVSSKREVIVRGPDDGEHIHAAGDLYRFLATSEETNGTYAIWEAIVPPGGGPPPHIHRREEEGFYIISGVVTVYADSEEIKATPGSYVHLPTGSKHWFRNTSDKDAKMLVLVAPGGMEELFKTTGKAASDPSAPIPPLEDSEKKRIVETAPTFGVEIIPPGD